MKHAILTKLILLMLFALGVTPVCRSQAQLVELAMKRAVVQAVAQAAPAAVAPKQVAGDWGGTLSVGGAELRLVLHLFAGPDGSLSGSLDSVDQGSNDIPLSAVTLKDSHLSLTVDTVHGTYEGTVNKDASGIDGTWTQGQASTLNFTRWTAKPAPKPAAPSDVDGTWQGTLDVGGTRLRILFKIANTSDGLTAQMQSPDQSPAWLPATGVTRHGSSLKIEMKQLAGGYEGKISGDLATIDGNFMQAGNSIPLVLKRAKE